MKNLTFILTFFCLFSTTQVFSQSPLIGQWTNTDTTFVEIGNDSITFYNFDFGCYNTLMFAYSDQGNNVLLMNVFGQDVPVPYALSNNNTELTLVIDGDTSHYNSSAFDISLYNPCPTAWACDVISGACVENSFGQFATEAECIAACSNTGGNFPDYIGQWRNNDSTELVEITPDTIFVYEFIDDCYNTVKLNYTDIGNDSLLIATPVGNVTASYSFENNDSIFKIISLGDTSVYYTHTFNITQYQACSDSTNNDSLSYLGMWKTFNDSIRYMHFTADSIRIYQFDSTDCYRYNSLVYSDIGNNQLQVALVITASYGFSLDGDTMSLSITGLGSFQMLRDSFDVSSWNKCTYNWKCNPSGCEDVGQDNGTFHTESDCQAVCVDTTSINEYYDLEVSIFPNPFTDYTNLVFSKNVESYQLSDMMGRIVLSKNVENSEERLYKSNLKSGVYLLQMLGNKSVGFEKIIIE